MHPFPNDFPTPKSVKEAGYQCVLKGQYRAQGAVWYQRKVPSPLNTKKGSTVDRF